MQKIIATPLGKMLQLLMKLKGSGGQALPGLVIEKIFPNYFKKMLEQLPEGVVVITGTNGKTTTTKIVSELLQANGKRIVTNSTGSNLTRGIVSSLIKQASWGGRLLFDVAVFEIDEAFAKQFVKKVKPQWTLALNVSRDQLDRFGEVDAVAELTGITMQAATNGVVTNGNDPRLVAIAESIAKKGRAVHYFSVAAKLKHFFPTDNELVSVKDNSSDLQTSNVKADVSLLQFHQREATYQIDSKSYEISLQLSGQHNFQNAAAAITLVRQLIPDADDKVILEELSQITTAFGRGQEYQLFSGSRVQLVLVKNPASFRQTLASYLDNDPSVMIVINDNFADSRDVSWLWDVDFSSLKGHRINLTSGSRAADMALRLRYDDIEVDNIETNIDKALKEFIDIPGKKVILATYTAMLNLHSKLTKLSKD